MICSSLLKGEILEGVVLLKFVASCNCSGREEVGGPDNVADRGCADGCASAEEWGVSVGAGWGRAQGGVSEMQGFFR